MTLRIKCHESECKLIRFNPFRSHVYITGNCIQFVVFLGSSTGQVALWDSRQVSHPLHYLEGHTAAICCGDWSPQCQSKVATGGDDMRVIVWDLLKVETNVKYKE